MYRAIRRSGLSTSSISPVEALASFFSSDFETPSLEGEGPSVFILGEVVELVRGARGGALITCGWEGIWLEGLCERSAMAARYARFP